MENLLQLFEAEVTQEIIDKANVGDAGKCIGAITLKAAIKVQLKADHKPKCIWGYTKGYAEINKVRYSFEIVEKTNMTQVTEPISVTFILTKVNTVIHI